ncbi:NAD(P)H-dependent oxidoreductase [Paenibacillus sp. Marseille-Q9583]
MTAIHQQVGRFLTQEGIVHHSIYVQELPAVDLLTANFVSEGVLGANMLVEEADIVAILTPIYKASYTGILKTYLDLLPQKALVDKRIVPMLLGVR